jgi:hypothetical protein
MAQISLGPETCYKAAYNNIQNVPQGVFFEEQSGDAAIFTSTQLSETFRTPMANVVQTDKYLGREVANDNKTLDQIKEIVSDNDRQEAALLYSFIPGKEQDNIPCSGKFLQNRNALRNSFNAWLTPQSWSNYSQGDNDSSNEQYLLAANTVGNCEYGAHSGHGLSQYGAYGMEMAGFNYRDILEAYYGGADKGISLGRREDSYATVTVAIINVPGICGSLVSSYPGRFEYKKDAYCLPRDNPDRKTACKIPVPHGIDPITLEPKQICFDTITLSVDDYLKGIAEIFPTWGVETWKAQTVAARGYALTVGANTVLHNCADHMAFRCDTLHSNLTNPSNESYAVEKTANEVLLRNGKIFTTMCVSCIGGPENTYTPEKNANGELIEETGFDGTFFERVAIANRNGDHLNPLCDNNDMRRYLGKETLEEAIDAIKAKYDK